MRIFIGQRVSDEKWDELIDDTKKIVDVLNRQGYETYSTLLDIKGDSFDRSGDWLFHAFKEIDKSDAFLAIVKSEEWSEGLLMEIGYILAKKKKLILAIKKSVKNTYLRDITKDVIEFKDIEDLINKISKMKI